MDEDTAQAVVTAVCKLSGAEVRDSDSEGGSWLLGVGEDMIALERVHQGGVIRLVRELGLEPSRVNDVRTDIALCRAMLRFNGDHHTDALWLGLRSGDDPALILRQDVTTEELTDTELATQLQDFVELYLAWFEAAESLLAATTSLGTPLPSSPSETLLKV